MLLIGFVSTAAPAAVLWRGDYETGTLSQWSGFEGLVSRLTVVQDPVRQGKYALRTELYQGDIASSGTRNEVTLDASQFQEVEGNDRWYAWSTLFPSDFPANNTWQVFTQWHHSGCCGSPPVEFDLDGERIVLAHNGDIVLWSAPLVRGVWHDFVVHVFWSSTDGYIDLYYDGQRVLDHKATPTLFPGEHNYLKQGLYRDANVTQPGVVYHDGMVMGTSLADVAPQLVNPTPLPPAPPPDAGTPDNPDAGPPVIPVQSGSVLKLPGGCSHGAGGSFAVLGLLAGALLVLRRRRS